MGSGSGSGSIVFFFGGARDLHLLSRPVVCGKLGWTRFQLKAEKGSSFRSASKVCLRQMHHRLKSRKYLRLDRCKLHVEARNISD